MALDRDTLRNWRNDAHFGNQWRHTASINEDYYDGNQYDAETARKYEERGMPLTVVNVCRDLVNTVVGLQERSQSDWVVRADAENDPLAPEHEDLAKLVSQKLKRAERSTMADRACLDACLSQHRAGIGWVEVGRSESLIDDPYRVDVIPWREMWWDPRSKSSSITEDAEYLRRVKFHDRKTVKRIFPKQTSQIEMAGSGSDEAMGLYEPDQYLGDFRMKDMTQESLDIWGAGRDLVALEEIYYRTRERGYAIRIPSSGRWVEFNEKNPAHMRAYYAGMVEPRPTTIRKMNRAVYCGDVRLVDGPSPYPHNEFPFVAFVYDREARTGSPYGMIAVIESLQDEINTRRSRMMWGLNATQVIYDKGAVDDPDVLAEEVGRADAMIELSENRKQWHKFEISRDFQLNAQQFSAYQDALAMAPRVASAPVSLSGAKESGVDSGKHFEEMMDAGVNSQSRAIAMYREGRRRVGELLSYLVIEDIGDKPQEMAYEDTQGRQVKVPVNAPTRHPDGYEYVRNQVQQIRMNVALDDTPTSTTYRRHEFQEIARTIKEAGSEKLAAIALPFLVEASESPNKREMAKMLRRDMGMLEPENEEERAAQEKQEQEQAEVKHLAMRGEVAEVAKKEAEAANKAANTEKVRAEIDRILAEVMETRQDIEHQQHAFETGAITEESVHYNW